MHVPDPFFADVSRALLGTLPDRTQSSHVFLRESNLDVENTHTHTHTHTRYSVLPTTRADYFIKKKTITRQRARARAHTHTHTHTHTITNTAPIPLFKNFY